MSGTENNYVEIYLSYNEIEAELIKGLLEEKGISAMVRAMLISPYPINIGRFAEKRIAVPEHKIKEAKELINQAITDGFLIREEGKFKDEIYS